MHERDIKKQFYGLKGLGDLKTFLGAYSKSGKTLNHILNINRKGNYSIIENNTTYFRLDKLY